jgi:hypothetical protein
MLDQLPPAESTRLLAAYNAFVTAVRDGSPDVEELGDALDDLFHQLR